jgi:hypothetical protein
MRPEAGKLTDLVRSIQSCVMKAGRDAGGRAADFTVGARKIVVDDPACATKRAEV